MVHSVTVNGLAMALTGCTRVVVGAKTGSRSVALLEQPKTQNRLLTSSRSHSMQDDDATNEPKVKKRRVTKAVSQSFLRSDCP